MCVFFFCCGYKQGQMLQSCNGKCIFIGKFCERQLASKNYLLVKWEQSHLETHSKQVLPLLFSHRPFIRIISNCIFRVVYWSFTLTYRQKWTRRESVYDKTDNPNAIWTDNFHWTNAINGLFVLPHHLEKPIPCFCLTAFQGISITITSHLLVHVVRSYIIFTVALVAASSFSLAMFRCHRKK